jgi:peptidoglycan/LPS O-acetylase OafA/YrhL
MTATLTTGRRYASSPIVRSGLAGTVAAAAATTAIAATGSAAGVSLDISGEPIPLAGFPQLTAFFALVGVALAVVLVRKARHPRTTFVRTTLALTALSLVPDLLVSAEVSTRALLMTTHLVAAAIVIPAIARRMSR